MTAPMPESNWTMRSSGSGQIQAIEAPRRTRWSLVLPVAAIAASVLAIGLLIWSRAVPRPEDSAVNLQRITDFVGMEEQPAASPDGKTAAFIAPVDGRRQVWVRLLAGVAPLQITRDDVDHEHPRWAPDSSSLIYFSSAAREGDPGMLWEISALGGTPRRIAASQGPGDLSHDGRRIATFRTQGSRTALAIVERDGSKSERAIALPALSEFSSPRWSPDDQSIAFVGAIEIAFNRALYVMDVAGGEPKQIANAQNIQGVAWIPDGSGLVYSSSAGSTMTYPPVFNLRTVSKNGERERQLTFGDVCTCNPTSSCPESYSRAVDACSPTSGDSQSTARQSTT